MLFYYQYQQFAFKERSQVLLQTKAIDTTLKALFLPELQCSRGISEAEQNCVDMLKADDLLDGADESKKQYYFELFSYATITITPVYPGTPPSDSLQIYHWPKPDSKNTESTFFVISLRDERLGDVGLPAYGYGYVQVQVYS